MRKKFNGYAEHIFFVAALVILFEIQPFFGNVFDMVFQVEPMDIRALAIDLGWLSVGSFLCVYSFYISYTSYYERRFKKWQDEQEKNGRQED